MFDHANRETDAIKKELEAARVKRSSFFHFQCPIEKNKKIRPRKCSNAI